MTNPLPTLEQLLHPLHGTPTEADWERFDANVHRFLGVEDVRWALGTLNWGFRHERDAAATIVARSDVALNEAQLARLLVRMRDDGNPYVRMWLANALYKRGNRDPEVVSNVTYASSTESDTPAGQFAAELLKAA